MYLSPLVPRVCVSVFFVVDPCVDCESKDALSCHTVRQHGCVCSLTTASKYFVYKKDMKALAKVLSRRLEKLRHSLPIQSFTFTALLV